MATDRHKLRILIFCTCLISVLAENQGQSDDRQNEGNAAARALFSPRVDYNEWMPVGRGDPLKNDPTYDYSPPVLDRVQYWGNSNKSKEKKDILLLGVTSKRSQKKEPKYNSIMRRNFFSHPPTRLMPPPMQTISPPAKHSSTENYRNSYYHHNHYNMANQPGWAHNSVKYGDSNVEESINYVSLSRPNKNSIKKEYPIQHNQPARKPWLHSLLEKEVTKPTSSFVMQPSKPIFESHSPAAFESSPFYPITTTINPITTSTGSPIVKTTVASHFQPTITPTLAATESSFSSYNHLQHSLDPFNQQNPMYNKPKPENDLFNQLPAKVAAFDETELPAERPMYLIIEGHSKVKTYGQKDNTTVKEHPPKIVPIKPKDEAIIKHVVSKNDKGESMEVMHLHKTHEDIPGLPSAPTAMGDLLSFLDSSLGNFFNNEETNVKNKNNDTHLEKEASKADIVGSGDRSGNITQQEKDDQMKNSKMIETPNEERERRQVFDYDNLPETLLREQEGAQIEKDLHSKHSNVAIESESDLPATETSI